MPPELEPARPIFAAAPDTCAFYFHRRPRRLGPIRWGNSWKIGIIRRAAYDGKVDAMHALPSELSEIQVTAVTAGVRIACAEVLSHAYSSGYRGAPKDGAEDWPPRLAGCSQLV